MHAIDSLMNNASNASVFESGARKQKLILLSTGRSKHNKHTMSHDFYQFFGYNKWTLPDKLSKTVYKGDIVLQTEPCDDNYSHLFVVDDIQTITSEEYANMYEPVNGATRNVVMLLKKRTNISIPKNVIHTSLGFKGIQATNVLQGHYDGVLNKNSVSYKWCMKNDISPDIVIEAYNTYVEMCLNEINRQHP